MKGRIILLGIALWLTSANLLPAEPPLTPVTRQDFYPLSQLPEAQNVAKAQGKPIGFLLVWPVFFPGATGFLKSGSDCATYFYHAFKNQAVLVAVDHSTGELDRLPKVAREAFHSPAEGGYAPCLCLTDPTFTKLIGMLPLWKDSNERRRLFAQYQAIVADKTLWGDSAAAQTAAAEPLPNEPSGAPPVPVASALAAAPSAGPRPLRVAPAAPLAPSADFKRELALTLAAERQQRKPPSPSPSPR